MPRADNIPDTLARQRALLAVALLLTAAIAFPPILAFSVDFGSFFPMLAMAALFGLFLPYLAWRKMGGLYEALESLSLTILISFASLVLSYAGMRFNMPLADGILSGMDRYLGLSSIAAIETVNRYPKVNLVLAWSYASFLYQILLMPVLLCAFVSAKRAHQFMLAYVLLCTISIIASIPFPSLGAVIGQGFDPATFAYVNEESSRGFIASFTQVREAPHFSLSLDIASGILTFPSLHAGMAVLCAWAIWPSRWLRWPFAGLNGLMLVSTVTCGAHYFVDIFAGVAIAILAASVASSHRLGFRGTATGDQVPGETSEALLPSGAGQP